MERLVDAKSIKCVIAASLFLVRFDCCSAGVLRYGSILQSTAQA